MNIIPATADMVWQVRSLSEKTFIKTRDAMYAACEDAAAAQLGALSHEQVGGTNGFRFPEDHLIVERARSAIQAAGLEPWTDVTCGGSDANELNDKGLDAVVISVGYVDIHTHQESMPIDQLNDLAAVCTQLILNN